MPHDSQPVTRAMALRMSAILAVAMGAALIVTSILSGWPALYPLIVVPLVVAIAFVTNYYINRYRHGKSTTWNNN
jgi:Flp pilus assembly protein TadB